MRIWRSPTSEGSRRQLFWQLASSSCHFGTPNNQRALYVWVSSDKEQETALISHKKQTDWKKNHDRELHNYASWKMNIVVLLMPSCISPGFRAKRWVFMKDDCENRGHEFFNGLCFNDRDCRTRGQKVKTKSSLFTPLIPEKYFVKMLSVGSSVKTSKHRVHFIYLRR